MNNYSSQEKQEILIDSLIQLYLTVKVRSNEDIENCNEMSLEKEKQQLRRLDAIDIIEYIKSSIEILMNLKVQNQTTNQKKNKNDMESLNNTVNESKQRIPENCDQEVINEYESMIQKLEADVRNHIRIEQQLKLHIESLQNKFEETERSKQEPSQEQSDEIEQLKRDKRRMDELITYKEKLYEQLQEQLSKKDKQILKLQSDLQQKDTLEKNLKQLEKKYNKDIHKLQSELQKYQNLQVCDPQISQHSSNADAKVQTVTTATTCSTNSNQNIDKPNFTSRSHHRNSQPSINLSDYQKLKKGKGFDQMMSMDNRDPSNGKSTNSKVIMAKQYFETMNNCEIPKQFTQDKTPDTYIEHSKSIQNIHNQNADDGIQRSNTFNASNRNDMNRLREKLSALQGESKQNDAIKRKREVNNSKYLENKENLQTDHQHQQIQKMQTEYVENYNQESYRQQNRDKRTVSDNTRSIQDYQKMNGGVKVLIDKTNNVNNIIGNGSAFAIKKPLNQERSQTSQNLHTQDEMVPLNSQRRTQGHPQFSNISNQKFIKKKHPGNGSSTSQLNQTAMNYKENSLSTNMSSLNATHLPPNNKVPIKRK